jgi:tmRNA-binding protein
VSDLTNQRTLEILDESIAKLAERDRGVVHVVARAYLEGCELADSISVGNAFVSSGIGVLMAADPKTARRLILNNLAIHKEADDLKRNGATAVAIAKCYTEHPLIKENQMLCKTLREKLP